MRRSDLSGRYSSPRVRPVKRAAPAHKAARFVDKIPADAPLWLRLHAVADKNIAGFVEALSAYREDLLRSLPLGDLVNALSTSDPLTTTDALLARLDKVTIPVGKILDDPLEGISAQYRDVILGGAKEALDLELPTLQRLPYTSFKLDLTNRYAVRYAAEMGSTLIRQVQQETIEAVRAIVASALRAPTALAPAQQAKLIREVVGLTSRQAAQVARYRFAQKGKDALIEKRVARFAARLHRQRALTIARTETIRASNAGVRVIADELAQSPMYRTTDLQFIWIVTPDDRLCERCAPMNDQVVGYSENFQEGDESPQAPAKRFSGKWPPLHPQCRCAIARKVESIEELEARIADLTPQIPTSTAVSETPEWITQNFATLDPSSKPSFKEQIAARKTPEGASLQRGINLFTSDTDEAQDIREAGLRVLNGKSAETDNEKSALRMLQAISHGPQRKSAVYRGLGVTQSADDLLTQYASGSEFDLGLSSFSSSKKIAESFADAYAHKGTKILVRAKGPIKALPAQKISANPDELEWITAGKFRVDKVELIDGVVHLDVSQIDAYSELVSLTKAKLTFDQLLSGSFVELRTKKESANERPGSNPGPRG